VRYPADVHISPITIGALRAEGYEISRVAIAHHGFLPQKGEIVGRGTAAELAASDSEIVRHAYLRS
jgi:hypothetical protein